LTWETAIINILQKLHLTHTVAARLPTSCWDFIPGIAETSLLLPILFVVNNAKKYSRDLESTLCASQAAPINS
jgi:hypothetical protein